MDDATLNECELIRPTTGTGVLRKVRRFLAPATSVVMTLGALSGCFRPQPGAQSPRYPNGLVRTDKYNPTHVPFTSPRTIVASLPGLSSTNTATRFDLRVRQGACKVTAEAHGGGVDSDDVVPLVRLETETTGSPLPRHPDDSDKFTFARHRRELFVRMTAGDENEAGYMQSKAEIQVFVNETSDFPDKYTVSFTPTHPYDTVQTVTCDKDDTEGLGL